MIIFKVIEMKEIINGILYDTMKSNMIASNPDDDWFLYRGTNGCCFIQERDFVDVIRPMTQDEAIDWLQEHDLIDVAVKVFEIKEA